MKIEKAEIYSYVYRRHIATLTTIEADWSVNLPNSQVKNEDSERLMDVTIRPSTTSSTGI